VKRSWPFESPRPKVRLVKAFDSPFANVVATARTCYSSDGVVPEAPAEEKWTDLARDLYQAGHHTTFQHAHFQFSIENVSRQFLWSFLHSHPFYNSEQVSQRYVEVKPDQVAIPRLHGKNGEIFLETVRMQVEAYQDLVERLTPVVAAEYRNVFRNRDPEVPKYRRAIGKKAMEIARYVLPVAIFAYLYHSVSGITLLRYARICDQFDAPAEQKEVVRQMVEELLGWDPGYKAVLEEPISIEELPESEWCGEIDPASQSRAREFTAEFDSRMKGSFSSLANWSHEAENVLARSVREVLGCPREEISDAEAIDLALSPARNPLLGESLNLTTHSKLARTLFHSHYSFHKRLSHTADSQDQRHRMTPASRPVLAAHYTGSPDYIRPGILDRDAGSDRIYSETMETTWKNMNRLIDGGVAAQFALYLLPNAATIRFTESSDLLNLRHKHTMRLCYNAQEEIWRASIEEASQIREVHPRIGKYLLPPCGHRILSRTRPICPEGARYCGVPVWNLDLADYERVI
jgi:flavin-dependent thymidylate synthase